jgi:hypothetical protein
LELPAPGNWKCPRCRTLITLKPNGSLEFLSAQTPPPFELCLTSTREAAEGLVQFVGAVSSPIVNGQKLDALKASVGEIAQVIAANVYSWNPREVYQVSVETASHEIQVQFADHGRTIDSGSVNSFFPTAARSMDEFTCRPHPKGGNVIRIVLRR